MSALAGRTIAVATHVYGTGPADAVEEYARTPARRLLVIGHAFGYAADVRSFRRLWENGRLTGEQRLGWHRRVPGPLTWAKDFVLSVWWGMRVRGTIDVFVGVDGLNAAAGLVLRRVGKAARVVFWTIDYVPERFPSRVLNRVYHWFDRLCVTHCDETWNLSPRMAQARRARGIEGRQRVVPMGAYPRPTRSPRIPHQIVFVGHLLEKQGVQLVLEALPLVRAEIPDARLLVIGDGPFRPDLERRAAELGLADAVELTGYLESHEEVERRLAESGLGVAVYNPRTASFTYYADPGKIKNYLAAGLPVVATDVPHSARELADRGAGVIVDYEAGAVAAGILEILEDAARHERFRAEAALLGAESAWPAILEHAFAGLAEPAR